MQCFNKFAKLYFGERMIYSAKKFAFKWLSMWYDRNDTTCSGFWMMHIAGKAEPRVIWKWKYFVIHSDKGLMLEMSALKLFTVANLG